MCQLKEHKADCNTVNTTTISQWLDKIAIVWKIKAVHLFLCSTTPNTHTALVPPECKCHLRISICYVYCFIYALYIVSDQ